MSSPQDYYIQQKAAYNAQLEKVSQLASRISTFRLLAVLGAVAMGVYIINSNVSNNLWWAVAGIMLVFLLLVRKNMMLNDEMDGIKLFIKAIDHELLAIEGNYSAFADGQTYFDALHPYSYDLDLFGKHTIYQMLCRAVTLGGETLLATRLSQPTLSKDVIAAQQQIIKELSQQPDLLLQFRVAGMGVKEEPRDQARITEWLQSANIFATDKLITTAIVVMPALSLAGIAYSIYTTSFSPVLMVVLLANVLIAKKYTAVVNETARQIGNTSKLILKYEKLLQKIADKKFNDARLSVIADNASRSLTEIAGLRKLVNAFDSRGNNMVGPLMNIFFLFNFINLVRLEKWKQQNSQLLLQAIDEMIETDCNISCAVYAFNHPANVYPSLSGDDKVMSGKNLVHPLLHATTAIGNNFSLGKNEQFYLLTGANMTGKSTFIRTIGVSLVMANIGLPLPAEELTIPVVDLYTSMRVTDSVQDDISYFKAELNRIKSLMTAVKQASHPYLILLDEPLRGTNSTDKQQGTRSIVENLLGYDARGIIATHDTILCDLEDHYPGRVTNYHFESTVEATGLKFDFKLKRGGSTSNNATILMRLMGIISN